MTNVWISPMRVDPKGELIPGFATKYDVSADKKTFTLHIDPQARLSDGTPITAELVKKAYTFGLQPKNQIAWGGSANLLRDVVGAADVIKDGGEVSGFVVKGERVLEIQLAKVVPGWEKSLGNYLLGMYSPAQAEADPDNWEKKPVTSGPYLLEWDPDTGKVVLTVNPNWWGDPKPTVQRVEIEYVQDAQTHLIAYDNNEVDIIQINGSALKAEVKGKPAYSEEMVPMVGYGAFFYAFRTDKPPFDDVNVRKAFAMAVDKATLAKAIYPGEDPADTLVAPSMGEFFDPATKMPFDVAQARDLLAKSKYVNSMPPIKMVYPGSLADWKTIGAAYQEQWKKNLGIEISIQGLETYAGDDFENANIIRYSRGASYADPYPLLSALAHSSDPFIKNTTRYQSAAIDKMIDDSSGLTGADRVKLIRQIDKALVVDEALYIPVFYAGYFWLVKPHVLNFATTGNFDIYDLHKVQVGKRN